MNGEPPSPAQLAAIGDAFVRELAALGRVRTYPKNTVIITEGDSSDSVFVVLSGKVKAFVSDSEGHELILNTQGPGDYVGEMALDGKPRSASVVTLEPTTFSVVQREPLRDAIRQEPRLRPRHDLQGDRAGARRHGQREEPGAPRRLRARGAAAAQHGGRGRDGKLRIPEKITQQEIAERVGASRDMVSRIFRDLTVGGYISVENRIVTINKKPPARW